MILKQVSFYVTGKVQNVMFRQTFIRAAKNRKLKGGASNDAKNHQLVHCSLEGDDAVISELINKLKTGQPLNSWGAVVQVLQSYDQFIEFSNHQVTTENVSRFNWAPNVTFYI